MQKIYDNDGNLAVIILETEEEEKKIDDLVELTEKDVIKIT